LALFSCFRDTQHLRLILGSFATGAADADGLVLRMPPTCTGRRPASRGHHLELSAHGLAPHAVTWARAASLDCGIPCNSMEAGRQRYSGLATDPLTSQSAGGAFLWGTHGGTRCLGSSYGSLGHRATDCGWPRYRGSR
jgi:hypothetical protein